MRPLIVILISCGLVSSCGALAKVTPQVAISLITWGGPLAVEATLHGSQANQAYDAWNAVKYTIDQELVPILRSDSPTGESLYNWVAALNATTATIGDPQAQAIQAALNSFLELGFKFVQGREVIPQETRTVLIDIFTTLSGAISTGISNYTPVASSSGDRPAPLSRSHQIKMELTALSRP